MLSLPLYGALACLLTGSTLAQVSVSVPSTVPENASPTIASDYVGFAFEARSFYYFAGV